MSKEKKNRGAGSKSKHHRAAHRTTRHWVGCWYRRKKSELSNGCVSTDGKPNDITADLVVLTAEIFSGGLAVVGAVAERDGVESATPTASLKKVE